MWTRFIIRSRSPRFRARAYMVTTVRNRLGRKRRISYVRCWSLPGDKMPLVWPLLVCGVVPYYR